MSKKRALITGITGQDGSYLAEILLEKGYEVHGIVRSSSTFNRNRIDHIYLNKDLGEKRFLLHYGDLVDPSSLRRILEKVEPDEIYNLAAQSHVKISFDIPDYTAQVDALGTLRFLDAIRETRMGRQTKFYQASTSELYGKVVEVPQDENTPFYPRSPYAAAKLYAYWITKNYREAYGVFAVNGILFNHESPRRGETFVTRKITRGVAKILAGLDDKIVLGNLNASRDWGYAPEYCEGMWRMLQQDEPEDFVLATGETHTVREFCEKAFREVGIELEWRGDGINERGIVKRIFTEEVLDTIVCSYDVLFSKLKFYYDNLNSPKKPLNTEEIKNKVKNIQQRTLSLLNKEVVVVSEKYFRPTEVDLLIGNPAKAKKKLGWEAKISFEELVKIMVHSDIYRIVKNNIVF